MTRRTKILIAGVLAPFVLVGGGATWFAWQVSKAVAETPDYHAKALTHDPEREHGLAYEAVSFVAEDGIRLRGWFVPAEKPRGGVVFVHGRSSSRQSFLDLLPAVHAAGYCALLYDTRGHRESDDPGMGDGFRGGYYDVIAAVAEVERRCGVDRVAAVGSSQGAGNSIYAAAMSQSIDAVVAIGTGPSLYDLLRAQERLAAVPDWLVAYATRVSLWRVGAPLERVIDVDAGPIAFVADIAPRPLFLIHGTKDEMMPVTQAGRLYAKAGAPKQFWIVEGGPHAGLRKFVGPEFGRRIVRFLDAHL